jgi:hypothetical protein
MQGTLEQIPESVSGIPGAASTPAPTIGWGANPDVGVLFSYMRIFCFIEVFS